MAIPPSAELATDGGALIELDEEIDGDIVGSRNYRFAKIGEPVPIFSDDTFEFDPQRLPSQPLAVSERFRLLFVAHPQGFCVARTKDVMASAEEIKENQKGPCVQELSLVDVAIGEVSILALSADDSLLAACVGSHVHFFAVSALLHKEQNPSFSVSLDDSIFIKDMRWARKVAKDYVLLSSSGNLYHGSGPGPIVSVMEDVDSVDWSIKGNFVAVAKKNTVSILSSQFKEKLRFSLSFQSVIGDSDVNHVIKVDSVRWIRPDSIAVGCFQLNDYGEEENYIVQVITSKGRRITDADSEPIVLSFSNVFLDFCPDAVPTRNGPHLFVGYLNLYGLAFIANRNLSQQVGLFSWSLDNRNDEAAMVEILNDAWNLRIDSQGKGDENVIVGLSVDKVSQNESVKFTLGDVETEVSPCCIIIGLSIDGKVSVFHFFSAAGPLESSGGCASEEEENASQVSMKHERSMISSADSEGSKEPTFLMSGRLEVEKTGTKDTIAKKLSPPFHVDAESQGHIATGNSGQKPLVESHTLKVDEPEKTLSVVLNQDRNAEDESTHGVKHSTGFFSGKVMGDFSSQSSSSALLASNAEALGKAPPTISPSVLSSTRSNARIDASKTSDGKFSSPLSDEVDKSDKHPLRSDAVSLRHPIDLKDKAKPSVTLTYSGQTALTAQGNKNSLPAYRGSQVPLVERVASGKSFQSEIKKELGAASSPTGLLHSVQSASKQFGNVEEMAKNLDNLLEGIVGKGGFRDASITSQANSVIELEDGLWALSDRCRAWRGLMNEQLKELQLLLDKTVQVLVRKVYMEGIFKQAADSRYWELWNRQKLSSELELKRRRMVELNQELTNKLIELERHFNSLEFNKFGENGGMQRNRRLLQNRQGHSGQIQSLHSLHNTMHAQLAAAEQLSGCLSKQMAVLSIESSGKHDVKKQLFDSIGLSYLGDTKRSPARSTVFTTPTTKEHLITSGSNAAKEQSRNQASLAKSREPETARRRRDSLDRTWASFDPPKTTVKRMMKEDYEKGTANRSLLNIDENYLSPQSQKKPEVVHSALGNMSGASLNRYGRKGTAEILAEQFEDSPTTSLYQRAFLDHGVQVSSTKSFSALPQPSILEKRTTPNSELGAFKLIGEKSKSSLPFTGENDSFAARESKFVQQSDTGLHLIQSKSMQLPGQSSTSPSDSTQSSDHFRIGFTKSTTWDQKKTSIVSETPLFDSKIPVTSASVFSSVPDVSERGLFMKSSGKPTQPKDSPSMPLQSAFSSSPLSSNNLQSLASFVSKTSSSTLLPVTTSSSGSSMSAKQEVSQPRTSFFSTLNFPSTLPSLTRENNISSISPSSSIIKSEPVTSLAHPPVVMYGSKTEGVPQTQTSVANMPSKTEKDTKIQASSLLPELAISTSDMKLEPLTSVLSKSPIDSKSVSEFDLGGMSMGSSVVTSVTNADMPSATETLSPVAPSGEGIIGSVKNAVSDSSHEEEMEEEAPETDQTTGFAFGNLGGFGIGSTPNSTTPKSNPFGVSVLNKDTTFATSPYMSASSGELFRPASFNFQSPQPSESPQPSNLVNFSGGFSSGVPGQVLGVSGFGHSANIGAGQQALGSVLGSFGQSRQLGAGLSGSNVASASGFGSGFMGVSASGFGGGFAPAASGGGFASLAAAGGGFAAAATSGGGFAAAATAGGGFAAAGGGFTSSAAPGAIPGGGFGGFSDQQGGGGFSAFGGGSGMARPPSELFTQMRK